MCQKLVSLSLIWDLRRTALSQNWLRTLLGSERRHYAISIAMSRKCDKIFLLCNNRSNLLYIKHVMYTCVFVHHKKPVCSIKTKKFSSFPKLFSVMYFSFRLFDSTLGSLHFFFLSTKSIQSKMMKLFFSLFFLRIVWHRVIWTRIKVPAFIILTLRNFSLRIRAKFTAFSYQYVFQQTCKSLEFILSKFVDWPSG